MAQDALGLVGTTIDGRYDVEAAVGEGGFAIVYRAVDRRLGERLAVKCLKIPIHFTAEARASLLEQFQREGRMLTQLADHPSIVRVRDVGTVPAGPLLIPYLVLEWLKGRDLEQELSARKAPLSEADAVALLRPVIDAVALAHREGIAHRDLKPANLFLAETKLGRRIKVLDFGIAKAIQVGEEVTKLSTKTASGFRPFTAEYGAPEQFWPEQFGTSGTWTDVHAFGLLLVELVSGRPALEGNGYPALLKAGTSPERPTPRAKGARVSDAFEALCQKALALDSRQRYRDARELLQALDGLEIRVTTTALADVGDTFVPSPAQGGAPGRTRRVPLVVGGLAVLGVGAALALGGTGNLLGGKAKTPVAPPAPAPSAPSGPPSASSATNADLPDPCPEGMLPIAAAHGIAGFCMDRTEVSVQQFRACVDWKPKKPGEKPCDPPDSRTPGGDGTRAACTWGTPPTDPNLPVNCVTQQDAEKYCELVEGGALPSLAEWRWAAAGAGRQPRPYPWGDAGPSGERLNACGTECDKDSPMYRASDGFDATAPVGRFDAGATPEGVLQLAGNVWEWVRELGTAAGGAFVNGGDQAELVRTDSKWENAPSSDPSIGFRCVRERHVEPR
jgi:eukaryotic-like serine/threonine-protein kinase